MKYIEIASSIDALLPDAYIINLIDHILNSNDRIIIFDDGSIYVPINTRMEVLVKSVKTYSKSMEKYAPFLVTASIGELHNNFGVITPEYSFVDVYFDEDLRCVTCDFYPRMVRNVY
jgi:hypothetical protein